MRAENGQDDGRRKKFEEKEDTNERGAAGWEKNSARGEAAECREREEGTGVRRGSSRGIEQMFRRHMHQILKLRERWSPCLLSGEPR